MTIYSVGFAILLVILVFAPTVAIYAQEIDIDDYEDIDIDADQDIKAEEGETPTWPFIVFNEGLAASWLTRIVKQTERSNFVFKDFLVGLYLRVDLENYKLLNYFKPETRLAVYYPMVSTFNDFPQQPNIPLHYAIDFNTGLMLDILNFEYFRLNAGLALHLFFLNSERWNYLDLGGSAFVGTEVPLAKYWTFLAGGSASLDNGNLGGNRKMEPFDIVYQYQIEIGVRYSKKLANRTFLFPIRPRDETLDVLMR